MKVAILAGGKGTRLVEETHSKSKAMVKIGDHPILWHVMRYYSAFGLNDFIVALGHKADSVHSYFESLGSRKPSLYNGKCRTVFPAAEPNWTIELVDTGEETMSGGRIKRLAPYLGVERFMLTWCDGLSNIDLHDLLVFHVSHGRLATLSAVHPPAKFGRILLRGNRVLEFREKAVDPNDWVNGAFFVLEPRIFDYIAGDWIQWEYEPMTMMAADGELMAYRHESFWQCMDTMPECQLLNDLWHSGRAPWKRWARA